MTDQRIVDAAQRFRYWTRTEAAVFVLDGVCQGSKEAEDDLIAAFIGAVAMDGLMIGSETAHNNGISTALASDETRVPCAECQVERDQTGRDDIWCSSDECYVAPREEQG